MLDDLRQRRRDALAEVLARMAPSARNDLVRALAAFDAAADGSPATLQDDASLRSA
jgi:hypothetical protein